MSTRVLTQTRRVSTTEYRGGSEHVEEFSQIVDSLGRIWDAVKHPRDHMGRFIRTFSSVKFDLPGGRGAKNSGEVLSTDQDGTSHIKITGIEPGSAPGGPQVGDVIRVKNKDLFVQTIKAKLTGRGAAGKLNDQQAGVIRNRVKALDGIGMSKQAKELSDALDLAMADFDAENDPAGAQKLKDEAIGKFRDLAEELDNERGKGFKEGQSLDDVKDTLSPQELARLEVLRESIDATFTARHALGDKAIDAQSSEGAIPANANERRLGVGQGRVRKAYIDGATVWDGTGPSLTKAVVQAPVVQQPIGQASTQQNENIVSALRNFTYQKLRSGLNRSAGWRQAQRVAPGDRFTVDKNGDQVIPSATVMYTPGRGGEPVLGMIMNVALDRNGNQTVKIRQFDPEYKLGNTSDKGKPLPYKDFRGVTSANIELADEAQQHSMFKGLALKGDTGVLLGEQLATALAEDTIAKLQTEAGRRFAESGAKRTSPVGAIDAVPIHDRIRVGAGGESIGIGDSVTLEDGIPGVVTYVDPSVSKTGTGTLKVMYPDGQVSKRITSSKFTKLHDSASEVFPGDPGFNDSNYVPTREEAAAIADQLGAPNVAEAIRSGADMAEIQRAMGSDTGFQDALRETPDLDTKREVTLQSGDKLSPEDHDRVVMWTKMAAASAGQFREPTEGEITPPPPPDPPTPSEDGELPQNPANPDEHITEGGTAVRESDGKTIVDDAVDNPIDSTDTEAIDQAIQDADGADTEEPVPEDTGPQGIAHKIAADLRTYGDEAQAGAKNGIQRMQIEKHLGAVEDAVAARDGEAFVTALQNMTREMNSGPNQNLRGSKMNRVLNGAATNGTPLHQAMRDRLDKGEDLFGGEPVQRTERAEENPNELPDGVPAEVDAADTDVSEGVLADDGSVKIMRGDQQVDEGFYVVNQSTVTEYPNQPTTQDIADFLESTAGSDGDGISVSFDENTGKWSMAKVGVFDDQQEAADFARTTEANQFVDIASGEVFNVALDGDQDSPAESVEDPRSEERAVRKAGSGRASARSTSKQKAMLDHVAGVEGADPEISRITDAVKNGEEITGADASRLADHIDGLDAAQFDKPSDKGVASQLAHKLARAAGEEGARGYSSQNTALRRTSDVGISLSATSRDSNIEALVQDARTDIKNGDNAAAAQKFRDAADLYDEQGHSRTEPSTRAREHADRLDAMGGVTAPAAQAPDQAPEQVPGVEPGATPGETPAGSPLDLVNQLFDQIGQPEDYGTEHQGRMLGEARALATEGLADDAADRLETAAAAEPDGSANKQLMLDTAAALRGQNAPPGPPDQPAEAGPGAPQPDTVDGALGTADSMLESERMAEGDNGPRGWDDQMDEVNNLITSIRNRTDDSTLAQDLRDLADMIDETFVGTDPSDATAEIRATADALNGGAAGPEGGSPEGAGGGTPFRLDDPQGTRDVLVTPEFRAKRDKAVTDYFDELGRVSDRLFQGVEENSIVGQMLNDRIVQAQQKYVNETRAWISMRHGGIENLTPERVAEVLARYPNAQDILDTWADGKFEVDPELKQGLGQVLSKQVASAAAQAKANVDELTFGDTTSDAWSAGWRAHDNPLNYDRHNSNGSEIRDTGDFGAMLPEVAATANYVARMRDVDVRRGASPVERQDAIGFAKALSRDIVASKQLFDRLRDSGVDPAPLENVLREQLDKHDLGSLLTTDADAPVELRRATDQALLKFRSAQDRGEPGIQESVDVLNKIGESMRMSSSATSHQTYASVAEQVINYSLAKNQSTVPEAVSSAARSAREGDRFGFMDDTLLVVDMLDAVRDHDAERVTALSGGRFKLLEWDTSATEMNPQLVTDDRTSEGDFVANFLFNEGMSEIGPNTAAALNSLFETLGGGIYRTDNNITEASSESAKAWRDGWNRQSGSDTREANQVTGVWTSTDNSVVLADTTFGGSGETNTVAHELGHAIDSMLAQRSGQYGYFSESDPEFQELRGKILEIASFSRDPNDSLMYWYFRNQSEGSASHNAGAGTAETWAEGHAAYTMMRRRMAEIEPGYSEEEWRKNMYRRGAGALLHGNNFQALRRGLTPVQIAERKAEVGKLIYEFYDRFENERLPEIMQTPALVRSTGRVSVASEVVGAPATPQQKIPTPGQRSIADTHNSKRHGLIQMQRVERGTPEWDDFQRQVQQASPGATMPAASAIYVTWNPQFAAQGSSIIWKAVMPGHPKHVAEYTDEHKATQLAAKFQRQQRVNDGLEKAHIKAEAEAQFDETAALVLAMIETGMRVGSSAKAGTVNRTTGKRETTFGGATMQVKHVFFPSDTLMRFRFPGKAGKVNTYESRNPELRAAVKQLLEGKKPSDQVFSGTNSGRTIDYLREATGIDDIINHDTRTRYATNMARSLVAKWPKSRLPKDEKSYRKAQSDVSKQVGAAINDGWQVARDSYISPAVWERFEQSSGMPYSFDDSPPYGLVEGETVTTLVPGAPGGPPAPTPEGAPGAPATTTSITVVDNRIISGEGGIRVDMTPSAYRAMQGMDPDPQSGDVESEGYSMPSDPDAVAERAFWYGSFQWPEPPIVAGPDPEFAQEDAEEEQ